AQCSPLLPYTTLFRSRFGQYPTRPHLPIPCWPSRASMPAAYSLVRTPAQAGFALRPPVPVAGVLFHHWSRPARLHLPVWRPAPLARASDAVQYSSTRRLTLLLVQPFALTKQLLWLLLTSRSAFPRRPF